MPRARVVECRSFGRIRKSELDNELSPSQLPSLFLRQIRIWRSRSSSRVCGLALRAFLILGSLVVLNYAQGDTLGWYNGWVGFDLTSSPGSVFLL